ncbi:MAG: NAD(P)H-dependent oxidoreductase [Clostridia bacterium]|nr:NAD(P)H-dependent oxidoreductase [Clostridia bacterium]
MILFINACVRRDSRTKMLADHLLSKTERRIEEVILKDIDFPVADEAYLSERDRLLSDGDYDHPMFDAARKFAEADVIVIAAPFWDLSFPAALKQYLEQINVPGITFRYSDGGFPVGLCKASKLYYVTTAGGDFFPEEYGFGYVKALARSFYGIPDVELIKAVGLDIVGADKERILRECINRINRID